MRGPFPQAMMPKVSMDKRNSRISYQFSFLIRLRPTGNPSRPPFSKGRGAFLNAGDKNFNFSPFEKGGTKLEK